MAERVEDPRQEDADMLVAVREALRERLDLPPRGGAAVYIAFPAEQTDISSLIAAQTTTLDAEALLARARATLFDETGMITT